jgi:superfamily I DNA/RNA helicase/mRNA-degrading endonuclease RelE of RelBE toxin-antitoxin system
MPNVAISSEFLTAFSKIPQTQQKKVREFVTRFQNNPKSPSINYETIHDVQDKRVRTVRIGLDYRGVVLHPDDSDTYLLVWVDHHDEAMNWAKKKEFDIHPITGALQVVDIRLAEKADTLSQQTTDKTNDYLFSAFQDDDLLRTGIPNLLLPAVKALKKPEDLDEIQSYLPEESYEALYWVANLGYSIDQALNEVAQPDKVDPHDINKALNHPDSKRRFVVVKSIDALAEILNAPLAKWRVFLHPSQESLVNRQFNGPARVLCGAGTGKTVVAMHRARYLATHIFTNPTDRILFTTYTRTLAANIRANLKTICSFEGDRIEVVHLYSWAASFLRSQGIRFEVASREEIDQCWSDAFSASDTGEWTEAFLRNEWERVVQAQGISNREEYLLSSRIGQIVRLSRPQRAAVWEIFDEYKRNLNALGKLDWIDVIRQTRLYLANKGSVLPYRAIIIDETQDLHPEDLKLIRQIVPEGANDLFFVGDAHQRIYGRPVVLSHCGINIKGRSSKLHINYRTTEEIRNWSLQVLTNQSIDDLDGGIDSNQEYRSLLHGEQPIIQHFPSLTQEKKFIAETINQLLTDVKPETICLVARTNKQLIEDYIPGLISAKIDYLLLGPDTPEDARDGIRLATMHRVKGLEFHHVIIAGVNAGVIPWESIRKLDEHEHYDTELQERCLFHVSSTRARETLTITSFGTRSKFLDSV